MLYPAGVPSLESLSSRCGFASVCKLDRVLLRCLNQSKAAIKATVAKIPMPTPMPIWAPSDSPWEVVAAAVAVVDAAASELIAELVSAIEGEDAVVDVVELGDVELSHVVLSVVCWNAVIVVPLLVRQPYERKE